MVVRKCPAHAGQDDAYDVEMFERLFQITHPSLCRVFRYGERNRLIRYGARRWGSDLLDDFNVYIIKLQTNKQTNKPLYHKKILLYYI
jgi:hypothetical protein